MYKQVEDSTQNFDKDVWSQPQFPNKIAIDEDILLVSRQDFAIVGIQFFWIFLIQIILLLVRALSLGFLNNLFLGLFDILMYSILIVNLVRFIQDFHDYFLSMEITTNYRIIDVSQNGLFKREVNQLSLDRIEDVSYKQNSLFQLIFNYGNVIVQTAGLSNDIEMYENNKVSGFVFNNVPHPREISTFISKLYTEHQDRSQQQTAELNARELQKVWLEKQKLKNS